MKRLLAVTIFLLAMIQVSHAQLTIPGPLPATSLTLYGYPVTSAIPGGTTVPSASSCTTSTPNLSYTQTILNTGVAYSCNTQGMWVARGGNVSMRYAASAVSQGQTLASALCSPALTTDCVAPTTTSGPSAGIALNSAAAGAAVYMLESGTACVLMTNQAVINDKAIVAAGGATDTPLSVTGIQNTVGFLGTVVATTEISGAAITGCATATGFPYVAYVKMIHPAATGVIPYTTYTASFTPASTAGNTCAAQTITGLVSSAGASLPVSASVFSVALPATTSQVAVTNPTASSSTAGSLSAMFCNGTAFAATASSGTYTVKAFNQ